jgi:hypothetical protein
MSCSRDKSSYGIAEWRQDATKDIVHRHRSKFGLEMHERGDLCGKSRQSIVELLGNPDGEVASTTLVYGLGPDPSFGIDIWELRVEFDDADRVRSTAVDVY